MTEKRKTHTSSAVKNKYNAKHYKYFSVMLDIDLVDRLNAKLQSEQMTKAEFARNAIKQYLGDIE